jgi:hypothetical protein
LPRDFSRALNQSREGLRKLNGTLEKLSGTLLKFHHREQEQNVAKQVRSTEKSSSNQRKE